MFVFLHSLFFKDTVLHDLGATLTSSTTVLSIKLISVPGGNGSVIVRGIAKITNDEQDVALIAAAMDIKRTQNQYYPPNTFEMQNFKTSEKPMDLDKSRRTALKSIPIPSNLPSSSTPKLSADEEEHVQPKRSAKRYNRLVVESSDEEDAIETHSNVTPFLNSLGLSHLANNNRKVQDGITVKVVQKTPSIETPKFTRSAFINRKNQTDNDETTATVEDADKEVPKKNDIKMPWNKGTDNSAKPTLRKSRDAFVTRASLPVTKNPSPVMISSLSMMNSSQVHHR